VTLSVPALHDPPLLSDCCAVSRGDLLLEELESWPGLLRLEVDADATVVLVPPGSDDAPAALGALAPRRARRRPDDAGRTDTTPLSPAQQVSGRRRLTRTYLDIRM
jgi:hypothetical protein